MWVRGHEDLGQTIAVESRAKEAREKPMTDLDILTVQYLRTKIAVHTVLAWHNSWH